MKIKHLLTIGLLLLLPALALKQSTLGPRTGLEVYFLDVGQGDAILIRSGSGKNILIDGGPDELVLEKIGRLLPYTKRKIDLMILTHPHADHLIGLIGVIKRYIVSNIVYTGANYQDASYRYFQEISGKKAQTKPANLRWDLGDNCSLRVLFPLTDISGQDFKNINNSSIVSELACGQNKILLMGDAETPVEKELLSAYPNLHDQILKTGHHGSKTASSLEFLGQIKPQLAVILVGKDNKYNLPSAETLSNLQGLGIKVIRTDYDGDLKITLNESAINYTKP